MLRLLFLYLSVLLRLACAECVVTKPGPLDEFVLRGIVLSPYGPLRNGHVHVRQGKIVEIIDAWQPNLEQVTTIDCRGSVISPGFINPHEHISYSLVDPLPDTGERYGARHEWRLGLNNHTMKEAIVAPGTETNATAWGELRHIFSGTTSIVGGDFVPGIARNLDYVHGLEKGLHAPVDTWDVFPLDDSSGILRHGDCDYGHGTITQEGAGKKYRYLAHIGEGIDAQAQNEFQCLSSQTFDTTARSDGSGVSVDIIGPNLVIIHGNSLTEQDFDLVAQRGAMVVWSPRSNIALYGTTLNASYLLEKGIKVALGTDWLPSGSATMSREAVCATTAMKTIYGINILPRTLWEMMTINAAKMVGFEDQLGSLEMGKLADIAVWGGNTKNDPYEQAIYTREEDIELVMRGGELLLAGASLHELAEEGCEKVPFGATDKFVCVGKELNTTFTEFQAGLQQYYPAILPGLPLNEPTCEYKP